MLFGVLTVSSWGYRALTDMMAVLCYMAEADCGPMAMGDMHAGALIDLSSIGLSVLPTFVLVAFVTIGANPNVIWCGSRRATARMRRDLSRCHDTAFAHVLIAS